MKGTKVKYTVALPNKVAETLEALSDAESMSKPETLRRAIAIYGFVYDEVQNQDRRLCIVDKDDRIVKEVVIS